MENYIVSARKYRPVTFDSVVGQRALTTTLKNAIAGHKLAHAYLFCGPRGVGKTTCARIFAKTINCLHPKENGDACDECESCKAFNEQRSYNIHELDAASNNSVEDIRNLIEQVRIPPQIGEYSVYIIDEVHMLSQNAFNAFLKTLEEPPHYAIFILATTEKNKVLPTILSRCQVYDFNRMSVNDMVEHLRHVAEKEGIEVDMQSLDIIAQKADGGMRDALSIFDQVVSSTNGHVTYQNTISSLNVLDYDNYFKLTDFAMANQVSDCMLLFNDILNHGFDGRVFINGFASHLRNLLMGRDAATLPLLEVSESVRQRYQEQAQKCTPKFLYRAMKLCNECDLSYRESKSKRFLVELSLIQVAQITQEDSDEASGRRPTKRLKPIFKTAEARVANASSATPNGQANVNSQNTVAANGNSANNQTQKVGSDATSAAGNATAANGAGDSLSNGTMNLGESAAIYGDGTVAKKIPTMRVGTMGISIKRKEEGPSIPTERVSIPTEAAAPAPVKNEANPLEEKELSFHWFEFANMLPKEENALANRMKNMRLNIVDANNFEAVVDNDLVEKYLRSFSTRIEEHLRQALHNRLIKMDVRVSAPKEVVRAFSRKEQYDMMLKKKPELEQLIQVFGLHFE